MKAWASFGKTESGDDLPVLLWHSNEEPIEGKVDEAYRKLLPIEYEEVGWVVWKLCQAIWVD